MATRTRVFSSPLHLFPQQILPRSFQLISQLQLVNLGFLLGSPNTMLAGHSTIEFLQAIFQLLHGLQSHPSRSSCIPRCIFLKRIASYLFPSSVVLSREPFFANVHFPRLSTRGTPFVVCLLRSVVFLRCRARRDFHSLHYFGQIPWCGAAFVNRCLPSR